MGLKEWSSLYERYVKRFLDFIISIVGLPILLAFYVLFGLLIKLEDGGPVLYKADRIGKGGRVFKMYKFRSMKVDAPDWFNADGSTFNSKDDPRVTRIGRFLRETSIDEIPQILNVLKGDMSIVGPRASLASALFSYKDDEVDKLRVRPGITGYTQAYYRNELSNREKRLMDAWYANNVSFWLDMRILIRTVFTVVKREGLYTNNGIGPKRLPHQDQ